MPSTLSSQSQQVVSNYLRLPFNNRNISCPYFNNKRSGARAALRVLVGKGKPEEIVDEAVLIALREKIDLKKLTDAEVKKFLVEHNLGVDCSALAYYILDAELKSRGLSRLRRYLKYPHIKNPIRKLITLLRPVENTGVYTLTRDENSRRVQLADIRPGDMITMLRTGPRHDYNHVLVVNEVKSKKYKVESGESEKITIVIQYIHSFQYPEDGLYDHGVRQEKIEITDPNKDILEQNWSEPRMREYARTAKGVKIKRLFAL
ncbi:MAG: hypothetical protein HY980_02600 [Candidatus Magasanikbacteria bacterium]|nr:hypothetical protein [Candidatus Magasanikbacteria bacterium]